MRLLYDPTVNLVARTLLRPAAWALPEAVQFPVTGRIRVRYPGGRRLVLDSNPTCYAAKRLFWRGYQGFEGGQYALFTELARGARGFLDIGANVGYYSLLAAMVNPAAEIHAFEPLPAAFEFLGRNLAANGFTHVRRHPIALSDSTGRTTFHAARNPKFDWVEHHLTATGSIDAGQASRTWPAAPFEVDVARLDDFVAAEGIDAVDLVKIDTEATEHRVLAGGRETFRRFRPVIFCEVLPGAVEGPIEQAVGQMDYRAYRMEKGRLRPVDRLAHGADSTNDHLFCPAEALHRVSGFIDAA